jgi:hypothetical protein
MIYYQKGTVIPMDNENESYLLQDRKEKLEIIKNFCLMDDTFMSKVFEDKECAELLLRVILGRDDLTVVDSVTQYEIKNLQGRSVKLDIYAVDKDGKKYDIEVQNENSGAEPERARYNSSIMDANFLRSGQNVRELPDSYVIFITENDVLGGGKPVYTIRRKVEELDNALFRDRANIIYVNGEIRDETKLGTLMQDFFCTDPSEMHYKTLSNRTKYFKQTDEGVDTMCKLMDDYSEKRARAAALENSKSIATELWNDGMRDMEKIAKLTKLPLDEVKKLFEGKTA